MSAETGNLEARLAALEAQTWDLADADDLDTAWVLWCGILVFCEWSVSRRSRAKAENYGSQSLLQRRSALRDVLWQHSGSLGDWEAHRNDKTCAMGAPLGFRRGRPTSCSTVGWVAVALSFSKISWRCYFQSAHPLLPLSLLYTGFCGPPANVG